LTFLSGNGFFVFRTHSHTDGVIVTRLFGKIRKTPVVAEPRVHPARPAPAQAVAERVRKLLGRSLSIRQVDAGSCNGCELEISALTNPYYDLERFGLHIVASPRHADCLLVTGPVTRNMADPLKRTCDATPDPKIVIAVGDCAHTCGVFAGGYGVVGPVASVVPVDAVIPGCPPTPDAILDGILALLKARP
jgi:Ni,Fe-hydrogenase III small subunit